MALWTGRWTHSKPVRSPMTTTVLAAYAPSYRASMVASPRRAVVSSPVLSTVTTSVLLDSTNASAVTSRTRPVVYVASTANCCFWPI